MVYNPLNTVEMGLRSNEDAGILLQVRKTDQEKKKKTGSHRIPQLQAPATETTPSRKWQEGTETQTDSPKTD
jgi:hypothetical protein